MELDLSAAANLDLENPDEKESTWQTHSSWLSDVRTSNLAEILAEKVRARIDAPVPALASSEQDLIDWLEKEVDAALSAIEHFLQAPDFDLAMANLLALDVFLARMLTALFKWRLRQRNE